MNEITDFLRPSQQVNGRTGIPTQVCLTPEFQVFLVQSGNYNEMPQTGKLINDKFIPHSPIGWKSKMRVQHGSLPVRVCLLVHRWCLLTVSSLGGRG